MTDENTSEGDQSLDNLLLAAYDSISEPLEATLGDEHGREVHPTTDSTPCACANAPNQPPRKQGFYGYGKSITSSGPIRLCDSNELCTKPVYCYLVHVTLATECINYSPVYTTAGTLTASSHA